MYLLMLNSSLQASSRFSLETEKLGTRHAYKSSGGCFGSPYGPENIAPMLLALSASSDSKQYLNSMLVGQFSLHVQERDPPSQRHHWETV